MVRGIANQGMPETEEAIGGIRDLAQRGQFTGQTAQDYMNPYMEQVVDGRNNLQYKILIVWCS